MIAAEEKFITNHVQSSEVLQSSNYTNYSSIIVSAEAIKHLTKGSDVSIKPVRKRHSAGGWSAPAEGPSHSTDQPGGKVHGQVRLANRSSKLVAKKQCHK